MGEIAATPGNQREISQLGDLTPELEEEVLQKPTTTLAQALKAYERALAGRRFAATTRTLYLGHLRAFFKWLGEDAADRLITSLTREELERYQQNLRSSPLALNTQAGRVGTLKRWLGWLVERGDLFANPAESLCESVPGHRRLPRVLSLDEVAAMLAHPNISTVTGKRDRAVLELLYSTGIRRSELVSLDVADVDLERGLLCVRHGKGRTSRVVPFGPSAKNWVFNYLEQARPKQLVDERERALFLDRYGKRLSGQMVYLRVKDAIRAADIPAAKRPSVHSLRHAFATHMMREGADIPTLQKLLGHACPSTTSAVYTRVEPLDLAEEYARTHPTEQAR